MGKSFVLKGNICQTTNPKELDLHENAYAVCVDGVSKGVFDALPELYEQGYRFCTLSELFAFKGVAFEDVPKDKYIKKAEITQGGRVIFN